MPNVNPKRLLREALFVGVRATGLPFLLRETVQRDRVTILCFHDTTPEDADRHFRELRRRYHPIALADYLLARERGTVDQLPKKSVIITFDDGHKRNAELGEIIRRHKMPVTIFLASGVVGTNRGFWFNHPLDTSAKEAAKTATNAERLQLLAERGFFETADLPDRQALSDAEIRELADLVDFQSHTRFHPCLPTCSDAEAKAEISGSKADLEQRYGHRVYALAYPNGDVSPREESLLREAGYACGLTTAPGYVDATTNPYALPRFVVEDDASVSELVVSAAGVWGWMRPALKRALGR